MLGQRSRSRLIGRSLLRGESEGSGVSPLAGRVSRSSCNFKLRLYVVCIMFCVNFVSTSA